MQEIEGVRSKTTGRWEHREMWKSRTDVELQFYGSQRGRLDNVLIWRLGEIENHLVYAERYSKVLHGREEGWRVSGNPSMRLQPLDVLVSWFVDDDPVASGGPDYVPPFELNQTKGSMSGLPARLRPKKPPRFRSSSSYRPR